MQEHRYEVVVPGTPDEVWSLFWARAPRLRRHGDVEIEILHPGDARGEGLIRHCTFRVPRYLLTGGVGQSWEWLTEVEPPVSWRYDAVGRPPWSRAEGRTRLEDLGDGRTRVWFTERYHVHNPLTRVLLEARVHRFISRDNDRTLEGALTRGLEHLRARRADRADNAS